jgi:hypothetical protein
LSELSRVQRVRKSEGRAPIHRRNQKAPHWRQNDESRGERVPGVRMGVLPVEGPRMGILGAGGAAQAAGLTSVGGVCVSGKWIRTNPASDFQATYALVCLGGRSKFVGAGLVPANGLGAPRELTCSDRGRILGGAAAHRYWSSIGPLTRSEKACKHSWPSGGGIPAALERWIVPHARCHRGKFGYRHCEATRAASLTRHKRSGQTLAATSYPPCRRSRSSCWGVRCCPQLGRGSL